MGNFQKQNYITEDTSKAIQQLIQRVITEWLPTAYYDKKPGYELEMYFHDGELCWTEFWISVEQNRRN